MIIICIFIILYNIEPTLCEGAYMSNEEVNALFASVEQKEQDLIKLTSRLDIEKINFEKSVIKHNNLLELLYKARNKAMMENNELNNKMFKNLYVETMNSFHEAKLNLSKCRDIEAKIKIIKPYFKSCFKKVSFETS